MQILRLTMHRTAVLWCVSGGSDQRHRLSGRRIPHSGESRRLLRGASKESHDKRRRALPSQRRPTCPVGSKAVGLRRRRVAAWSPHGPPSIDNRGRRCKQPLRCERLSCRVGVAP